MKSKTQCSRFPQRAALAALLLLTTTSALRAQQAPVEPNPKPATTAATELDEIIQLSPFEVTTDKNEGYVASSSLAGSRLNTALRDISSPISVITPQFMKDTGVTKVQDLLLYTTNTEAAGTNGNFYGASGGDSAYARDQQLRPQNQTRVRGLFGADLTRDFWQTNIPLDSYNITGVEIQRGPNSILYGLGSPAGIINYTIKTPYMSDNKYSAEVRVDNNGSLRGAVDLNQAVAPGLFAVRLNALDEKHKFRQDGKYEKNERVTFSPRWTPKMGGDSVFTQFTLNYEKGKQRANQPTLTPPLDFMSNWYERMGKYVRPDTFNGAPAALNIGPYYAGSNGAGIGWFDTYAVVFADPNSSAVGGPGVADLIRQRGGSPFGNFVGIANFVDNSTQPAHVLAQKSYYANNPQATAIINAMEQSTGRTFSGFSGWQGKQILDTSVFDYWNHDVAGPNNTTWHDFDSLNFSATQTYLDGRAGIELVYDKQQYEDGYNRYLINPNRISIDINPVLRQEVNADGTLKPAAANPNFGRPFAFSADANSSGTEARRNVEMRENYRMTAFYKLNLEKLLDRRNLLTRIIGEQTFTGLGSQQRYHHYNEDWQLYNVGEGFGVYGLGEGTSALHYLNSSVDPRNANGIRGLGITGLGAVQRPPNNVSVQILDQDSRAPNVNQFSIVNANLLTADTEAGKTKLWSGLGDNKTLTTTRAFIWQARFLDDTVVGLFGLRKDDFEKRVKGTQTTQANGRQAPDGRDGAGATVGRVDPRSPLWKYDPANDLSYSGTTHTYGVMVHSPEFINRHLPWGTRISVGYNQASNVNPSDVGFNILRSQLPPQSGTSKDYTVLVSTLHDRLTMRATWYKTIQKNATFESGPGIQPGAIAESFVRTMNGMMVETQTSGNRRVNTTPEFVINKWFFGGTPTQGSSGYFTAGQWKNADAATRAALVQAPMLTRAAAATWGDPTSHVNPINGTIMAQPPISDEEVDYRRAWFEARTDAQWYRPLEAALPGFGQEFWSAFQFNRTANSLDTTGGASGPYAGSPYRGYSWGSSNPPSFKNTTDIIARGLELEVAANLTRNWRVSVNASRSEAMNENILDEGMKKYYAAMVKVAKDGFTLNDVQSGGNNWANGSDYWHRTGFAQIDEWGDESARLPDAQFYKFDGVTYSVVDNGAGANGNHQMLGEKWVEDTERDYLGAQAAEGRSIREIRKWRFNMVTSYDFTAGRLKGVGVGGAVRWQDKTNLGYYPKFLNGGWVADLDKPIPGPDEWNYDAWVYYRYKLGKKINVTTQLNLRNLFNNKNLIPINANPDGTVGQYRLGSTFGWELSTRFEF